MNTSYVKFFEQNMTCTLEELDNKMVNFSLEQYYFNIDLTKNSIVPQLESYFDIEKNVLVCLYFVEGYSDFLYVKKIKSIKQFEFMFNFFDKTRSEVVEEYNSLFYTNLLFEEIFENIIGDINLFYKFSNMTLLRGFKAKDDDFFDFSFFLEFYLHNFCRNQFFIKGPLISNLYSETYLNFLAKPVLSKKCYSLNNVAGLFMLCFEHNFCHKNLLFYETILNYMGECEKPSMILFFLTEFFEVKKHFFLRRPFSSLVLTDFNFYFLMNNCKSFNKESYSVLNSSFEEKILVEKSYLDLKNMFTLKNKSYYLILKSKNDFVKMFNSNTYYVLNSEDKTRANLQCILKLIEDMEKFFNSRFLTNSILNNYITELKKLYS